MYFVPPASAACSEDPDLFYSEAYGDILAAKKICLGTNKGGSLCPFAAECLEHGLDEQYGVWGGTSGYERRKVRKLRGLPPLSDDLELESA